MNDNFRLLPLYLQEALKNRSFSVQNKPPDISWFLTKKNSNDKIVGVGTRGEIVMVYGPPKSRKSTILNCITASAYNDNEHLTLGFNLDLKEDETILYFDTEMPMSAFHRRQMKLNRMCGYKGEVDIPNYHAYSLKPHTWRERIEVIEYIIKNNDNVSLEAAKS